jgi:hypothetical protein
MALVKCSECKRDISDKAVACPGCGAPTATVEQQAPAVSHVKYIEGSEKFTVTMTLMVKLAMRAVQDLGWKLDQANESLGLITFQTGVSWGSWSGVSCSLNIQEVSPNSFKVVGTGKQNVRGGQLFALDIGGEAQGRARKVIERMKEIAS